jgi:orotate phosphoribosyltransferase
MFAEHVSEATTRIAGAELGGVSLAAATSLQVNLPFVIVRNAKKGYGTSNLFEGMLASGDRILVVEDIATTGGQVIEAARMLEEAGAKVEKIVAVIDRQEGARENVEAAGFEFAALFTSADLGVGQ